MTVVSAEDNILLFAKGASLPFLNASRVSCPVAVSACSYTDTCAHMHGQDNVLPRRRHAQQQQVNSPLIRYISLSLSLPLLGSRSTSLSLFSSPPLSVFFFPSTFWQGSGLVHWLPLFKTLLLCCSWKYYRRLTIFVYFERLKVLKWTEPCRLVVLSWILNEIGGSLLFWATFLTSSAHASHKRIAPSHLQTFIFKSESLSSALKCFWILNTRCCCRPPPPTRSSSSNRSRRASTISLLSLHPRSLPRLRSSKDWKAE